MRQDILSDVLSTIKNGENVGKKEIITMSSSLVKDVLMVLQRKEYIGEFEYIDDKKGGKFKIKLLGKINNCRSIRPRIDVRSGGFDKYKRRFLPASGFGIIIVTTSKGVMIHSEAEEKGVGGKLLAFVY